jgi:two-component system, chemotaxis family, chemotaxis protein CheY
MAARVLIVDDDAQFRDTAAELLVARGLEVFSSAASAQEALEIVAENCPDGILLDVNLPDVAGYEVAKALTARCPRARVVLTSATLTRLPDEMLAAGAIVAFVAKDELADVDLGSLFRPADT